MQLSQFRNLAKGLGGAAKKNYRGKSKGNDPQPHLIPPF